MIADTDTSKTLETELIAWQIAHIVKRAFAGCQLEKVPAGWFNWDLATQATGFDFQGYHAVADTHAIWHSLKNHGIAAETARGQKRIDRHDFEHLPVVLAAPDRIAHLGQTRIKREVIGFEKAINGWLFRAAMEIRPGRRELALVSFYTIQKALKKIARDEHLLILRPQPPTS
jgi:hypothetical protein